MSEHSLPTRLDRYLDGLLDPQEAAAFEREVAADPALAAELELQRRIDASLSRAFAYPEGVEASLLDPAPIPFVPAKRRFSWKRVAAVASLAASLTVAYIVSRPGAFDPPLKGGAAFTMTACEVYKRLNDNNWVPSYKCKNDEEFVAAVRKRLGTAVLIPLGTVGVTLDGWGYPDSYEGSPLSIHAMYLMTHVGDRRVLVMMDTKANENPVPKGTCEVNLFRREVGSMVLYEVSPLDAPKAIEAAIPL
jgi:hypothetical protein